MHFCRCQRDKPVQLTKKSGHLASPSGGNRGGQRICPVNGRPHLSPLRMKARSIVSGSFHCINPLEYPRAPEPDQLHR
jgi:hypothetical protein